MMGAAFMIDGGAAYELPSTLDLAAAVGFLLLRGDKRVDVGVLSWRIRCRA
jgi:hypothetical protein